MRLGLRLEIGIGIEIDLHRSDFGLRLGLRLEIGIGIEIVPASICRNIRICSCRPGIGIGIKGRFGIEIGAALGDWDWD